MGFLIWLPVVFAVKALFSSGKGGGKAEKKKKKKKNEITFMCQFRKYSHSVHTQQSWQAGNTNYQHFLISVHLSNIIDHYLCVLHPAFLSFTLMLCHGSAKLFFQFLDFPFMVSDQAVLLCVVLLE